MRSREACQECNGRGTMMEDWGTYFVQCDSCKGTGIDMFPEHVLLSIQWPPKSKVEGDNHDAPN